MKTLLRIVIALLLLYYSNNHLFGQQGAITAGKRIAGTGGTASFSIGQPDYLAFKNMHGSFSLGLQQVFTEPTGIPFSLHQATSFKAYPNPTAGLLTLELFDFEKSDPAIVEIHSFQGQLLMKYELAAEKIFTLNLTGLPKGAFFLRVIHTDKTGVIKIVKQ